MARVPWDDSCSSTYFNLRTIRTQIPESVALLTSDRRSPLLTFWTPASTRIGGVLSSGYKSQWFTASCAFTSFKSFGEFTRQSLDKADESSKIQQIIKLSLLTAMILRGHVPCKVSLSHHRCEGWLNSWKVHSVHWSIPVNLETGSVAQRVSGPFTPTKASVAHWHVTWRIQNPRIGNKWWIAIGYWWLLGEANLLKFAGDLNAILHSCFTKCWPAWSGSAFCIAYLHVEDLWGGKVRIHAPQCSSMCKRVIWIAKRPQSPFPSGSQVLPIWSFSRQPRALQTPIWRAACGIKWLGIALTESLGWWSHHLGTCSSHLQDYHISRGYGYE